METIIGLLFVLLPVILKAIGKRLEQAGNEDKAGKIREFSKKYLDSESEDQEFEDIRQWFNVENEEEPIPEPVVESVERQVPSSTFIMTEETVSLHKTAKKTKMNTPVLKEEDVSKDRKEKIDPKKMVIYSEIMKPKYQDQGIV